MIEQINYENAKIALLEFFKNEFPGFPIKLQNQFLNFFYEINKYEEEGVKLKPNILFTNNIEAIVKAISTSVKINMFNDVNETMFNYRMKNLIPFCKHDWIVYINIKDNEINYGVCKACNSIKEQSLELLMLKNQILQDKLDKVFAIHVQPLGSYSTSIKSLKNNELNINYSLTQNQINWQEEINEFVDASFSKLRTTPKKLSEIKTMYANVFNKVFKNIHGAICVVVDKDYVDNGFFSDGIWLKEPISFSKLFMSGKSFSENKLEGICSLFIDMLDYDGITVVDNLGRIRAYNVFVENNISRTQNIIGGARKRAAYTIINSRRKRIVGVYFQSHDGEMFYEKVKN